MFRALLCPSSGARDHVLITTLVFRSWFTVGWSSFRATGSSLQPGHYSSLTVPNLQPTTNQERNDQCGNQHRNRELLMMGIVVPETC